jgi:C4-dicarboxylate transporter
VLVPAAAEPVPPAQAYTFATTEHGDMIFTVPKAGPLLPVSATSSTVTIPLSATVTVSPVATVRDPGPEAAATLGVPPACVDFASRIWNNFGETIMPLLGGVAREAVMSNRDPAGMSNFDAVKIQNEILECTYSEYYFIFFFKSVWF